MDNRIFMFSLRNLKKNVWRCSSYEFEDIICEVDDVDLFAPEPNLKSISNGFINESIYRFKRKIFLSSDSKKMRLDRNYDVLFYYCQNVYDLQQLNAIQEWREHFKTAVCWIEEIWANQLNNFKRQLKILSKFDFVITICSKTIKSLQDLIPSKCQYIPPGVDTIRFSPYPAPPPRQIEILSIGRRSKEIHQNLLKELDKNRIFYIYDTFFDPEVINYKQHRILLANLAKRSKYFLVHPANFNQTWKTGGQIEYGPRYFEGVAAGCILVGDAPECETFCEQFDWPNALIRTSSNYIEFRQILENLSSNCNVCKEIQKYNITQSLLRHDWVYRWKKVLDLLHLDSRPALLLREKRLKEIHEII
jgi:glycosyltransferase involved in cell wall biosynthesis